MASAKPTLARKAASLLRREPSQARSQATIETLFDATAQIIEQEGFEALSTNKIAAKAGFSIGTLYQYFPTKEAIVTAIIDRERRRVQQGLHELLSDAQEQNLPPQEVLRTYIRQLIEGFGTGRGSVLYRKAARAMIRVAWQMDHQEHVLAQIRETTDRIALYLAYASQQLASSTQLDGSISTPNRQQLNTSPVTLFVMTRAILGVVRRASLERSPLLGTPEFEAELSRLAWCMLSQQS